MSPSSKGRSRSAFGVAKGEVGEELHNLTSRELHRSKDNVEDDRGTRTVVRSVNSERTSVRVSVEEGYEPRSQENQLTRHPAVRSPHVCPSTLTYSL